MAHSISTNDVFQGNLRNIAIERRGAATSVFTLLLSSINLLASYKLTNQSNLINLFISK